MPGSQFGTLFHVSTWGESHGAGIGAVIDGCPAGIPLSEEDIQQDLDRRKPGGAYTTPRKEADRVEILSGVFEGRTTGCPISLLIRNENQQPKDYSALENVFRPGHADFTFQQKYGIRDHRGGGRSSGRETAGRVCAGAIARKLLAGLGIEVYAYAKAIGPVTAQTVTRGVRETNPFYLPDIEAAEQAKEVVSECMMNKDSLGGIVEIQISRVPAGLGDPVFEKLDARLAYALFSIGAVKGVEIGEGFHAASLRGSENNDGFILKDGHPAKATNHSGGTLGGMSDGDTIVLRAAFKPTPSIFQPQKTITRDGQETEIAIKGRHDPLVVPRAVVVCEAMCAITLADALLTNLPATYDAVLAHYQKKGAL